MSEGGRRLFSCPENLVASRGTRLLFLAIFDLLLAAAAIGGHGTEYLIGFVLLLLFTGLEAVSFLRMQPVAFSDDGIEAFLGGWVRQRIAWRDLDRIEKRAVPGDFDGENRWHPAYELILFRSRRRTITVSSGIVEFEALKQLVTEEAKQRGIELVLLEPQPFWRPPLVTQLDEL